MQKTRNTLSPGLKTVALAMVALSFTDTAAKAMPVSDAAKCATFSYANLDYERSAGGNQTLRPSRVAEWETQAAAFEDLAVAEGMSIEEVRAFTAKYRKRYVAHVHEFVNKPFVLKSKPIGRAVERCKQLARTHPSIPETENPLISEGR